MTEVESGDKTWAVKFGLLTESPPLKGCFLGCVGYPVLLSLLVGLATLVQGSQPPPGWLAVVGALAPVVVLVWVWHSFQRLPGPLVIAVFMVAFGAWFMTELSKPSPSGALTACKSNLKNIGTALEMYSTDFEGVYPGELSVLTPNYLRSLPTCPAAAKVTYAEGYQVSHDPPAYTFRCHGRHHTAVGIEEEGYPFYNSVSGLTGSPD